MASDLTARSQRATWRGHTHTPHAALAGSTPASSQAAPPSRARPPSQVRPGQQGRSFQGHTFLLSSGMSSPERSWGRPGVRLPGPRSGRAAGCCGPRLSSAHGPQMGRLRTAPPPPPTPTLSSPFPSRGHLAPPWSPSPARDPLANRVYIGPPLLSGGKSCLSLERGDPPAVGRPWPCKASPRGGLGGRSAEHQRPWVPRFGVRLCRPVAV